MKPFVRSPYNYDMSYDSGLHATENHSPSLSIQSAKDESDINFLVRRFGLTGELNGIQPPPSIEEFAEVFDYQSAMNLIVKSRESFMELSPEIRFRFANDPGLFVAFCADPANIDEARKLGIALPKPPEPPAPVPQKVEIVNPEVLKRST